MIDNIQRLRDEAKTQISDAPTSEDLERLRVHYLGKKGILTTYLHQLKELTPDRRREVGALLNETKGEFEGFLTRRQVELRRVELEKELSDTAPLDLTLPGRLTAGEGSLHPVSKILGIMTTAMKRIGFSMAFSNEVELEYYNFEALNTPADHPARDMQDTFYINQPVLLRSHTSPVQIRTMKAHKPPLQVMAFGRVYRSDFDVTHTPMFHQFEGLMVDKNISFADLKGILHHLVKHLFGSRPLRFRPSYFPFTEPSAEVDMQCFQCSGKGCRLCKKTGWLEIGGCGMVHPNVFRSVSYDPDRYTGFAFGMGIERIAMLKYGIDDLRSLFENDYRMLEQF